MNITNLLILNRDTSGKVVHPADGFYHVVPKGEFPHPESGDVLVLDDTAHAAFMNRFNEDSKRPNFIGLLVDQEHFSYDEDHSSAAYGWIRELANRDTGTWARIDWTPLGRAAVEDGTYKLISPVFKPEEAEVLPDGHRGAITNATKKKASKRVRPLRLDSCGLTNTPNLRGMVPLSNRGPSGRAQFPDGDPDNHNHTKTSMKKVNALLGLSEDASEEAAVAEVTKLKNRATTLETENSSLRDGQVEADLAKYANRFKPEAKDKIKAQLLTNRAPTIELLESLQPITAPQGGGPLHNRAAAGTPKPLANRGTVSKSEQQDAAVQAYKNTHKVDFETAWNAVMAEKPELFEQDEETA